MEVTNESEYWKACREALRSYRYLARLGPVGVKSSPWRPRVQAIVLELGALEIAIDVFEKNRAYLERAERDPMGVSSPLQHVAPDGKGAYRGDFPDLESMLDAFKIHEDIIEGYDVLLAWADNQDPNYGRCYVLLHRQQDGALYEVEASHCSCSGYEDAWHPYPTTLDELESRVEKHQNNEYQEREALTDVVAVLRGHQVDKVQHILEPVTLTAIPNPGEESAADSLQEAAAAQALRGVIGARIDEVVPL